MAREGVLRVITTTLRPSRARKEAGSSSQLDGEQYTDGSVHTDESVCNGSPPTRGDATGMRCLIRKVGGTPVGAKKLKSQVEGALAQADDARYPTRGKKYRSLMGHLMKTLCGKADGKQVAQALADAMGMDGSAPKE